MVEPVLENAAISAVNLSEVLQKAMAAGVATDGLEADLDAVGVRVYAAHEAGARRATQRPSKGSVILRDFPSRYG